MREKLQSLPMVELREIAKANGIKSVTTMRKEALITQIIEAGQGGTEAKVEVETSIPVVSERNTTYQRTSTYQKREEAERTNPYQKKEETERTNPYQRRDDSRTEARVENDRTVARQQTRTDMPGKIYISPVCPEVPLDGSLTPEEETRRLQADIYDPSLDSGIKTHGILEIMPEGFGFIRCENYMPGENDIYVAPAQIKRYNLNN